MNNTQDQTKPARLGIKRHRVTGMKYFFYSEREFVEGYKGSGSAWKEHLVEHGIDVETVWVSRWYQPHEQEKIRKFARLFSRMNNIVESEDWANRMTEEGYPTFGSHKLPTSPEAYAKGVETRRKNNPNYSDQAGKKNPSWKGWYVTPWGVFETAKQALVSDSVPKNVTDFHVYSYCKRAKENRVITKQEIKMSSKVLYNKHEGKTYKEIGFDFVDVLGRHETQL